MSKRVVVLSVLCATLLLASPVFAAPTVEELLKSLSAKAAETKTAEGDLAIQMSAPMDMKGVGKLYMAKAEVDGKTVEKMLSTVKMTMTGPDGEAMTMDIKMVNDGQFVWQEMRMSMMPGTQVMKTRVEQENLSVGPNSDIEQMKKQFDFTAVSEEKIDGRPVYVLTGKPKAETPMADQVSLVRLYVDSKTSFFRRLITIDKDDKEMVRFDLTNVKINEKIDPKMFEYTPPEGAQVRDMTEATEQ